MFFSLLMLDEWKFFMQTPTDQMIDLVNDPWSASEVLYIFCVFPDELMIC